jgi:hypothetical protein
MSKGAIFVLIVVASFPAIILVAIVVKLWEVRKAARWPSTAGKVITNDVQSHKNKPGDIGYNFGDTEVSNEPLVEYEYQVGNRTYRGRRITIGEKTSGYELEAILERYPVGTSVTVYYDPADPQTAVLERDLPWGVLAAGGGCLLLFFIGGPLLAAFLYFNGVAWLKSHLANPQRAPFVAAAGGFGLLVFLFGLAFMRYVRQASRWPVVPGRVVASGVESYRKWWADGSYSRRYRTHYKSSVLYTYEVNGRQYTGDRLTIGVNVSATVPGFGERTAARYPVGTEVEVHYNPQNPGESVLHPHSRWHYLIWLVAAGMFALAWAVATGRLG